jgi:hypothetical protein
MDDEPVDFTKGMEGIDTIPGQKTDEPTMPTSERPSRPPSGYSATADDPTDWPGNFGPSPRNGLTVEVRAVAILTSVNVGMPPDVDWRGRPPLHTTAAGPYGLAEPRSGCRARTPMCPMHPRPTPPDLPGAPDQTFHPALSLLRTPRRTTPQCRKTPTPVRRLCGPPHPHLRRPGRPRRSISQPSPLRARHRPGQGRTPRRRPDRASAPRLPTAPAAGIRLGQHVANECRLARRCRERRRRNLGKRLTRPQPHNGPGTHEACCRTSSIAKRGEFYW